MAAWKVLIALSICITVSSTSSLTHHSSLLTNLTNHFSNGLASILTLLDNINVANLATGTRNMNSSQLIVHYGHSVEEHTVTTSDGYILRLFRIPGTGPAVLIVHGVFSSSDDYLTLGPKKSLPIVLAELGYDVWLGNTRGNTYSRHHETLSPDSASFWDFSWHEMGVYDLPAMIDYILEKANVSKLAYIGHSQGTTSAFVMLSEKLEYNDKINVVVSLAPISWISNLTSPLIKALTKVRKEAEVTLKALHFYELLPHRGPVSLVTAFCASSPVLYKLCFTIVYTLLGFDYEQIDYKYGGIELSHIIGGSSLKQGVHYLQNIESKLFQKYDYGSIVNIEMYGSTEAPSYPVDKITSKNVLIWANNDFLSNFKDVQQLRDNLPNVVETYEVKFARFNHLDYLWAKNANVLVYDKVIAMLNKYTAT